MPRRLKTFPVWSNLAYLAVGAGMIHDAATTWAISAGIGAILLGLGSAYMHVTPPVGFFGDPKGRRRWRVALWSDHLGMAICFISLATLGAATSGIFRPIFVCSALVILFAGFWSWKNTDGTAYALVAVALVLLSCLAKLVADGRAEWSLIPAVLAIFGFAFLYQGDRVVKRPEGTEGIPHGAWHLITAGGIYVLAHEFNVEVW